MHPYLERKVLFATVVTEHLEPLILQNAALNVSILDTSLHNVIILDDIVATVSDAGILYVSLMNLISNPQRVRCGTRLGTLVSVSFVNEGVPQTLPTQPEKAEVNESRNHDVYKVYQQMNLSIDFECTSSSEIEVLSSTDPSEKNLSEREVRERTDADLIAPFQDPNRISRRSKSCGARVPVSLWVTYLMSSMICL